MPYSDPADYKKWASANREKLRATQKRFAAAHGQAHRDYKNGWRFRMLEKLAGRPRPALCEVCGKQGRQARGGGLHFDHDHATGAFRGWLCFNCNAALGHVGDNVETLMALADYLRAANPIQGTAKQLAASRQG